MGHFGKYHNALGLSLQILHEHCFQFLMGLTLVPRENKSSACAGFGGTGGVYCGIFRNGLLGTAVGPFGLQQDIDRLNGFTSAIFVGTSNVIGETSPLLFEK